MVQLGFLIPKSNAAAGNRTRVGSVAPLRETLIQDALPAELPQPWHNFDEKRGVFRSSVERVR